ncbi:MAG: Neutral protease precursor [Thermoleophilia bacterium]|nr:Neutral protease precursor [Thermoleophilia bacterium]
MSFFSGVVDVARSVLGIPEHHDAKRSSPPPPPEAAPKRGEQLAADVETSYEPAPATDAGANRGPSLADALVGTHTSQVLPGVDQAPPAAEEAVPAAGATMRPSVRVAAAIATATIAGGDEAPTASAVTTAPTATSGEAPTRSAATVASTAQAKVYDAGANTFLGTSRTLATDGAAGVAAANVQRGLDYYARTFGRNGLDGAGSGVDVLVNDRSKDAKGAEQFQGNGGYYATVNPNGTTTEAIHFGTGKRYAAARGTVDQYEMQYAEDLTIHELTHGVIRKETGQLGGEADAAGATNEGIADVMAAAATRDWSLGESMYADDSTYRRMRNIADPNDPTAVHGLWTSMDQVRAKQAGGEEIEEHWASGVISTAAYRVQQRLGGGEAGWKAVEQTFYDTIHSHRLGDMSFEAVASGLRTSAAAVYGQGSAQAQAFDTELRAAGL